MTQKGRIGTSVFNAIIGVILMVIVGYYLSTLLKTKPENIILTEEEKTDLNYLTQAIVYDGYNYYPRSDLRNVEFAEMSNAGKTAITAKYLYLKNNGRINPDDSEINLDAKTIDIINDQAKKTFDNIFVKHANFSITLDENGCGSKKFSTDFGFEASESCLEEAGAFELKDMYYEDDYYIVEAYIAFGEETRKREGTLVCKPTEDKIMSYFSVYSDVRFNRAIAVKEYDRCCDFNFGCEMEGAAPKRDFMISTAKKEGLLYKIVFKKKWNTFIPYRID